LPRCHLSFSMWYSLVIEHSYRKSPFWIGKPSINGPFSAIFHSSLDVVCMFTLEAKFRIGNITSVPGPRSPWENPTRNPPEMRLAVRVQGVGPAFAASQVNEADLAVLLGELPMDWKNADVSAVLKRQNMGNMVISPRKVRKKKRKKWLDPVVRPGVGQIDRKPIVSSQTKGWFLFVCASTKSGTWLSLTRFANVSCCLALTSLIWILSHLASRWKILGGRVAKNVSNDVPRRLLHFEPLPPTLSGPRKL